MKKCQFCAEEIQDEAIKCRFCGEFMIPATKPAGADVADVSNVQLPPILLGSPQKKENPTHKKINPGWGCLGILFVMALLAKSPNHKESTERREDTQSRVSTVSKPVPLPPVSKETVIRGSKVSITPASKFCWAADSSYLTGSFTKDSKIPVGASGVLRDYVEGSDKFGKWRQYQIEFNGKSRWVSDFDVVGQVFLEMPVSVRNEKSSAQNKRYSAIEQKLEKEKKAARELQRIAEAEEKKQAEATAIKQERDRHTYHDAFYLTNLDSEAEEYSWSITGTVENISGKKYSLVSVEINLLDSDGAVVGSALDNVNNLEPGQTWKFKATNTEDRATKYIIKDISGYEARE